MAYYRLTGQEEVSEIRVAKDYEQNGQAQYKIQIANMSYLISDVYLRDGILTLTINGQPRQVVLARQGQTIWLANAGRTHKVQKVESRRRSNKTGAGLTDVRLEAVMPGTILEILVREGEEITQGQPLLVQEAMKMEQRLTAVGAGRVAQIHVQPGQLIEQGQLLMTFDPLKTESS